MEITPELLPWSTDDEANWASFLNTNTGRRLIPKIAEQAPTLLAEGDVNKILIRSGELRGVQEAIRILISLSHAQTLPQTPETSTYPSLTDDTKWGDGQKLEPEPTTTIN